MSKIAENLAGFNKSAISHYYLSVFEKIYMLINYQCNVKAYKTNKVMSKYCKNMV